MSDTTIYLPKKLASPVSKIAKSEHRSVSNYVQVLIKRDLAEKKIEVDP